MNKMLVTLAAAAIGGALPGQAQTGAEHQNPFLQDYTTVYQIPPFDQIRYEDYLPALRAGIDRHNAEINAIIGSSDTPTFENTILPLDMAGETLDKVVMVFAALEESNS